jgi:hypothetical protein
MNENLKQKKITFLLLKVFFNKNDLKFKSFLKDFYRYGEIEQIFG